MRKYFKKTGKYSRRKNYSRRKKFARRVKRLVKYTSEPKFRTTAIADPTGPNNFHQFPNGHAAGQMFLNQANLLYDVTRGTNFNQRIGRDIYMDKIKWRIEAHAWSGDVFYTIMIIGCTEGLPADGIPEPGQIADFNNVKIYYRKTYHVEEWNGSTRIIKGTFNFKMRRRRFYEDAQGITQQNRQNKYFFVIQIGNASYNDNTFFSARWKGMLNEYFRDV